MKSVMFDLDGTLLDTIDDIADSMNEVLKQYRLPCHTVDEYKIYVGDGVTKLVERAVASIADADVLADVLADVPTDALLAQLETAYRAAYLRNQAKKTLPYDGIPALLAALTARGITLSVFSNKPHGATLEVMARYFPETHFDVLLGQRPGYPIKPDPSGAFEIMDRLGLPPAEVLYVGDTGTDMQTAKAAGLKAVGALWGFRQREELLANGADVLAEAPLDILHFV